MKMSTEFDIIVVNIKYTSFSNLCSYIFIIVVSNKINSRNLYNSDNDNKTLFIT